MFGSDVSGASPEISARSEASSAMRRGLRSICTVWSMAVLGIMVMASGVAGAAITAAAVVWVREAAVAGASIQWRSGSNGYVGSETRRAFADWTVFQSGVTP